uniref:Uncharacterized protein n=1 Tax=uncultured virus TaxID=340016 RepID=D5L2J6_9VIRU|nr:hypothetical protein [uncultured virus]
MLPNGGLYRMKRVEHELHALSDKRRLRADLHVVAHDEGTLEEYASDRLVLHVAKDREQADRLVEERGPNVHEEVVVPGLVALRV